MEHNHSTDLWSSSYSPGEFSLQVTKPHLFKKKVLVKHKRISPRFHRSLDPSKVIIDGKRIRFSFLGLTDIMTLANDSNQPNPLQLVNHYQQVWPTDHNISQNKLIKVCSFSLLGRSHCIGKIDSGFVL